MVRFRWLLLALILAAVVNSPAIALQPAPAEADTVAKIDLLGGRVYRNEAGLVDMVDLKGPTIGDEHLAMLQSLPALRMLSLDGSRVTDLGLEQLLQVPTLEEVSLLRTAVTPAAAKSLKDRHPKVFHVALSPRGNATMLVMIPLIALPIGGLGIWLFSMARRKRDILAPRTYVQGIGYGLLLVVAAIVMSVFAVARFLGFDFHLSDLGG